MKPQEHIVAVVEPDRDGETTLDIARDVVDRGGRATVVVIMTNKAMKGVRDFAASENLTVPDASEIYLDRLAEAYANRIGSPDRSAVMTVSPSSGRTLFEKATRMRFTTVAMPQKVANRRGWRGPVSRSQVPVLITPAA